VTCLTLKEAAKPVFGMEYGSLRNKLKWLMAQGCPIVQEGRNYLVYPEHVEAWRVSRYAADARRHLRQGGFNVSPQEKR
jgi:hypothetical protein